MMQQNSSGEGQIPESNATNEETNVVGLNRIDAKGNSSKKKDSICRWQEDHGITREVLEQQFDKSRDDAAKTLKVSPSTLKRACRDLGISRWPNHNRKRPNSSLNQKEDVEAVKKHKGTQPCPALPPAEGATTHQGNIAMSVKVTYQNDTVRFPLSSSSTMKYLEEQLERRFKIPLDNFCIKYQDEEDEWISVMCDSDLMYCMEVYRSCGKSVIRMMLTPKYLTAPVECNTSLISSLNEHLPSPVLAQQAQPPPNAATPVGSLSNRVGPTGSGKGVWDIREPPNATPVWLSESNTSVGSDQQRDVDHSVNTECSNQEELLNLVGGMTVRPPRMNLSLPSSDSPRNLEWVRCLNHAEHREVEELQNGKEMMRPAWKQPCIEEVGILPESMGGMVQLSSGTHPERNDDHSIIVDGLPHMPLQLPSSPRMNYALWDESLYSFDPDSLVTNDEDSEVFNNVAEQRAGGRLDSFAILYPCYMPYYEESSKVWPTWFEILTLPLRSAWKGIVRIWRKKYCVCLSTPK